MVIGQNYYKWLLQIGRHSHRSNYNDSDRYSERNIGTRSLFPGEDSSFVSKIVFGSSNHSGSVQNGCPNELYN